MNRYIAERFGPDRYPDSDVVPLPLPDRMNNDIPKYFEEAKKPIVSTLKLDIELSQAACVPHQIADPIWDTKNCLL
jgi:hypothetical protein